MVSAREGWTSSVVRSWYPPRRLTALLRAQLHDDAAAVGDPELGRAFRDAVARPDLPEDPLAWAPRLVGLSAGGWAVARLRFRLGDVGLPFVDVVATTAPPTTDGLDEVAASVLPRYEGFSPRCLRVEVPDAADLLGQLGADDRFGTCAVHSHVLAGRVEELRRRPRVPATDVVRLVPLAAPEAAERVAALYAALAAARPDTTAWAAPEDSEALAEHAEAGVLREVLVEGRPAGVVAAARDDDHALAGFEVKELALDAAHRGRRLAAGVVQHLLDALPTGPDDVLWGTIHPDNLPSLRTAASVGRTTTSSLVWVAPRGTPGMPAEARW
jgi:hypothetical protein